MSCCYEPKHTADVPKDSVKFFTAGAGGSEYQKLSMVMKSGFTSFLLGDESMKVVFHAHNGTVLYETPAIPPRKVKGPAARAAAGL